MTNRHQRSSRSPKKPSRSPKKAQRTPAQKANQNATKTDTDLAQQAAADLAQQAATDLAQQAAAELAQQAAAELALQGATDLVSQASPNLTLQAAYIIPQGSTYFTPQASADMDPQASANSIIKSAADSTVKAAVDSNLEAAADLIPMAAATFTPDSAADFTAEAAAEFILKTLSMPPLITSTDSILNDTPDPTPKVGTDSLQMLARDFTPKATSKYTSKSTHDYTAKASSELDPSSTIDQSPKSTAVTVSKVAADTTQLVDVGATRKADVGATRKADVGATRKADVGATRKADVGATRKADVGATRKADVGATQKADVGATRKADVGATRKADAGATRKADAGATRKAEAGATRKAEAGATRKAEAGATRKAEAGATRKVDASATPMCIAGSIFKVAAGIDTEATAGISFEASAGITSEATDATTPEATSDSIQSPAPATAPNLAEIRKKLKDNASQERFNEIISYFNGNKSAKDMFTYMWDLRESHQHFVPTLVISQKCAVESEKFRNNANTHYKNKNFDKALELYNLAIMAAPHPAIPATLLPRLRKRLEAAAAARKARGENEFEINEDGDGKYKALALGYANRSAVLCAQQQYEKCLSDINFAIMYGLPDRTRVKLEDRRSKCVSALSITKPGDVSPPAEYKLNFEDIVEKFDKCKISEEPSLVTELLLSPCKRAKELAAAMDPQKTPSVLKVTNPNPALPNLSNAVGLAYHPTKGRHLIAQRAIRPGEVLATDPSYVSTLYFGNLSNHCCNCFTKCHTIQPCPNCAKVVFCSVECWIKGLTGDHLRECSSVASLAALQKGVRENLLPSLVYKVILNTGHMYLRENLPMLQLETMLPPHQRGFNSAGKYISSEFRVMYHLLTNKELIPPEELYNKCTTAFILIKLLIKSERYYVSKDGDRLKPSREELLWTGATLFHFLMSLSINAYEVSRWHMSYEPTRIMAKPLGAGVFPTLCLVNHSCTPSSRHYFDGKQMVLRANTFIPMGGEVSDDYCGNFYEKHIEKRLVSLVKYYIDCACDACIGKWPEYNHLTPFIKVKCVECGHGVTLSPLKPKCRNCKLDYSLKGRPQNVWWRTVKHLKFAKERYDFVALKMDLNHTAVQEDLNAVCNYLEVLKKSALLPTQEHCFAQETLYKLFCYGF